MAELKPIEEIFNVVRGISFPKSARNEEAEEYYGCLRTANIQKSIVWTDLWKIPAKYLSRREQLIQKNDIIVSIANSLNLLGKSAMVTMPPDNCTFGTFVVALRPKDGYNPRYLYYTLQAEHYYQQVRSLASTTTNISNISTAKIKTIQLPIPPLPEQERIVARIEELFSQLDAGVETLKTSKAQLAVYRQAVITDAYSLGGNASFVRLDEVSKIIGGITKGRNLSDIDTIELPYLRVANVQNGYLDLSEIKTIQLRPSEKERYLLKYGDVLYTEGGDRDKLGRGTVWRNEVPDCVHQNHVFKARIDQEKALPEYVAYWSMSTPARNYFYQKGKQSVNLASINKTVLSALTLPLPNLEVQRQIINHIESRLSVCDSIEQTVDAALQQAEAMRQSILKKAFEGKL